MYIESCSWLPVVRRVGLSLVLAGFLSAPVHAREVSGVALPDGIQLGDQSLVLNGAGLRSLAVFKAYVIGMYLPRRVDSAAAAMDAPGAKRLHLVLMRDLEGSSLAKALQRGIVDNQSEVAFKALQARVEAMAAAMNRLGEAQKGSQVLMDFVPGQGTRVVINGKPLMADIPGDDFFRALQSIWLGAHPAGDGLKESLLGRSD